METKTDVNSTKNQKIKGLFVEREVKACFSYEMAAILRASQIPSKDDYSLPTFDEIENAYEYKCPKCGEGRQNMADFDNDDMEKGKFNFMCPNCKAFFDEEPENEPQEIFECWIVSGFLFDKLKAKGNPVLQWGNNWYWGRCTTGQAILLDEVISEICSEMEILEGQANDWSKNDKKQM